MMNRHDELLAIFRSVDENILTVVEPLIDDLIFIEKQLEELRSKPFIKYHPKDDSIQKITVAGKMYKDLLASQKDIVRILCMELHKDGTTESDSPLRAYLSNLGKK